MRAAVFEATNPHTSCLAKSCPRPTTVATASRYKEPSDHPLLGSRGSLLGMEQLSTEPLPALAQVLEKYLEAVRVPKVRSISNCPRATLVTCQGLGMPGNREAEPALPGQRGPKIPAAPWSS